MDSAQGFRIGFVDDAAPPFTFGLILAKQSPRLLDRHIVPSYLSFH
jgi:hypothetical protein